jgi:hypothetical protein
MTTTIRPLSTNRRRLITPARRFGASLGEALGRESRHLLTHRARRECNDRARRGDADGTTPLSGVVGDQAGLHGLRRRIGGLGMTLISVTALGTDPHATAHSAPAAE